jgi:hypothetical protein
LFVARGLHEQTIPLAAAAEIPVIPVIAAKDGVGLGKVHVAVIPEIHCKGQGENGAKGSSAHITLLLIRTHFTIFSAL